MAVGELGGLGELVVEHLGGGLPVHPTPLVTARQVEPLSTLLQSINISSPDLDSEIRIGLDNQNIYGREGSRVPVELNHRPHGVHQQLIEDVEQLQGYEVSRGIALARLRPGGDAVVVPDPGCRHVDVLSVDGGLVNSVAEALHQVGVGDNDSRPLGITELGASEQVEVLVSDHMDPNPVGVESVQEYLDRREEMIIDIIRTDTQLRLHRVAGLCHISVCVLEVEY